MYKKYDTVNSYPYRMNIQSANRAPYKVHIFISIMPNSPPNQMLGHLLESSHRDDSKMWSNIGFGEEITQVESIEVNFTFPIWISELTIYLDRGKIQSFRSDAYFYF